MSNQRHRRGMRGPDFSRREHNWGSPRSGSPGSPGINGSPRTGRRDRRDFGQQHLSSSQQTDHDMYVDYLRKKWFYSVENADQDKVTYFKIPDPSECPGPNFDTETFFKERQINMKRSTPPPQQAPIQQQSSHHQHGLPS